jgi:hypothetical protein
LAAKCYEVNKLFIKKNYLKASLVVGLEFNYFFTLPLVGQVGKGYFFAAFVFAVQV